MTKILTRKPNIRYRAAWEDKEFFMNSRQPKRYAVIRHSRPHVWNWLGTPGSMDCAGHWMCDFFGVKENAEKKSATARAAIWDKATCSNDVGNNDHLHGLCQYDVVEVVPVEIVGEVR